MTTIYRVYNSESEALASARSLVEAGVDREKVRVLRGSPLHDANREREGTFADKDGRMHDANREREGTFGDVDGDLHDANREREGTFADKDGHMYDGNRWREGEYGDIDHDTVTSMSDNGTDVSTVNHAELIKMLRGAGLGETEARREIEALHHGKTILMVADSKEPAHVEGLLNRL
ncbi:MAG: hypothetical protein HC822_01190 [Oscillochloris sp.]|nr:hypothetical protein [Oscillochloris sp.]